MKEVGTRELNGRPYTIIEPIPVGEGEQIAGLSTAAGGRDALEGDLTQALHGIAESGATGGAPSGAGGAASAASGTLPEFEVAYAEIGRFVHVTALPKGATAGVADIPKDFILTAHGFRSGTFIRAARQSGEGAPIPGTRGSRVDPHENPINYDGGPQVLVPKGKTLTFLAPDTYTLSDPGIIKLATELERV